MIWELLGPASDPTGTRDDRVAEGEARPVGHHFAVSVMAVALNLVLQASTSLRAAAKCFGIFQQREQPSFWTIRNWVLRLGLYELRRTKCPAADWVFIVDATIAIGQHKALVILGVRLSQMEVRGFNLGHQDVTTLGLCLLTRCDGPAVQAEVAAAARAVGVPRLVVSDGGADVKKGVALFQAEHPEVDWNYDLTHRLARLLEKRLATAVWWQEFGRQVGPCRQGCQQTAWSHLQPPTLRTKARWFNLEPLIEWGLQVLAYGRRERLSGDDQFATLFGWLGAYEPELKEARQIVALIEAVSQIIKHGGLNAAQVRRCEARIRQLGTTAETRGFGQEVREFLREQLTKVRCGETLLGSSDVIESVFGKYKAVVERSPLKAITSMVLMVAALTSVRTKAVIVEAMEAVGMADVDEWFAENGERSLLAKRREVFNRKIIGTKPA